MQPRRYLTSNNDLSKNPFPNNPQIRLPQLPTRGLRAHHKLLLLAQTPNIFQLLEVRQPLSLSKALSSSSLGTGWPLPTRLHKRSNLLLIPLIRDTDDSAQPNAWMGHMHFFELEGRDVFPLRLPHSQHVRRLRLSSTPLCLGLRHRALYYSRFSCIRSEHRFHRTWTDYGSVNL